MGASETGEVDKPMSAEQKMAVAFILWAAFMGYVTGSIIWII